MICIYTGWFNHRERWSHFGGVYFSNRRLAQPLVSIIILVGVIPFCGITCYWSHLLWEPETTIELFFFFTPSFHVISAHVFSVLFLLEEFWKNNITASKLVEKTFSNLGHYNGIIYNLPPIKGTRNNNNHQLAMSLTARQQLAKISGYAELQAEASTLSNWGFTTIHDIWNTQQKKGHKKHI